MNYQTLKSELKQGFNTYNTESVLSHVLMPWGLSINILVKMKNGNIIDKSLIGRSEEDKERIIPGIRSLDGTYTSLVWKCGDIEFSVESAQTENEEYILITPIKGESCGEIIIDVNMLWGNRGEINVTEGGFLAVMPEKTVNVYINGEGSTASLKEKMLSLTAPISISTGQPRNAAKLRSIMDSAKGSIETKAKSRYGDCAELYLAMTSCMGWDTIYEPINDKVCSTVSRIWNCSSGGYVLFCWDTYFGALLTMAEDKKVAYSNLFAITDEMTKQGFIPNYGSGFGKSVDRSQPPVGSLALLKIYKKYGDEWVLRELFPSLLTWNRWWVSNRLNEDGTLCWGSDSRENCDIWGANELQGAKFESGLDNSPMYDDVPFDEDKRIMLLKDVGLTSLYILDCECLAEIADILGEKDIAKELRSRAEKSKDGLETLWDEETGIYQNRRMDTGEFYKRLSPTCFYALFSDRVSKERAKSMMKEHFYNPQEFWGDYILPSISRNDWAYKDQDYWRGRIWAPMNYLVYEAMNKAGLKKECRDLADKSQELFLGEWREHGHVHENYNCDTGIGCDGKSSDKFYHWGSLLCLIKLMDEGLID